MAEWRLSKNGRAYLQLSEEESLAEAERKAKLDPLPTTPEGWVEYKEKEVALSRSLGYEPWAGPVFDNWCLWLEYLLRRNEIPRTTRLVGQTLPQFIDHTGSLDMEGLSRGCQLTPKTVKKHLSKMVDLGADFTRLREWPHPLRK